MQLAAVLQQGMERWCFREEGSSNCRVRGATTSEVSPHLTQQWQMLEGSTWRETSRFCVLANPETREPQVGPGPAFETCLIEEEVSPLPSPEDRDRAKVPTNSRVEALGAHFSPDMLEGVAQVPDNLRERVISEVHCLLAQAQFAMSPQQAELDLDLLVEECCHALMIEQVAHGHIDAQQISREVLRTVLRGWGKARNSPQSISPSPLTARQHLPQFLENEVRTHAHSRGDLLMDDGPAGCESQVLGCQVLPCRSPQGTMSPCPIS